MLKNRGKFYITDASFGIAQNIFTGSIIQNFLLKSGVAEHNVALYVSAMSTISFFAMLLTSPAADKIKNIIKFNAFANLCYLSFFFVLIFFSFSTDHNASIKYISVFAVGVFIYVAGAFRQNLTNKLPFHILKDINDYGPILGTAGVITGLVGIAFYGIMTLFMNTLKFFTVMRIFMPLGALAIIISFLASYSYKPVGSHAHNNEIVKKKLNIFKCKTFFILAIPDFLHGFWSGIFNIAAVIGSFYKIITPEMSGMMMLLIQSVYTVSCVFYAKISHHPKPLRYAFLIASIGISVLTPLLIVGKKPVVFLSIYAVLALLFYFIGKHYQVLFTRIVNYEILGQYSAFHGAVKTLGSLTGAAIAVPLLAKIGGYFTLGIAALAILISSLVYYIYTAKKNVF